MEINIGNDCNSEKVLISNEAVHDFLDFLERKEEYLDTGLGAFHTDDHSNW